jgi:3-hydroxyacyl-CoA dehydrogenase / enoyl-CoA hydratase / 3-hydroxybutyryl-CoA epimerase
MNGYNIDFGPEAIATVAFDLPGKVNVMNDHFLVAMDEIMARLEGEGDALKGVILTSAKKTFFAGGDLELMGNAGPGQEQLLFDHFQRLKSYFRRLENLSAPVVAALNGTALGGGYELALACDRRIAVDRDDIAIGLPEIKFQILPGGGGVVRLTRLLGLENAAEFLLTGKSVDPKTALERGLVDDLAWDEAALTEKARLWIKENSEPVQPWDTKGPGISLTLSPRQRMALFLAPVLLARYADPKNHAARKIIEVAAEGSYLQVDAALRIETRAVVDLMVKPEAHAAIAGFFEARKSNHAAN